MSSVILQPAAQDASNLDGYIALNHADAGDFTAVTFSLKDVAGGLVHRPLIRVPLAGIPGGSVINTAVLTVNFTAVGSIGRPYALRRMPYQDFDAAATYNTFDGANAWPGGAGAAGDTEATGEVTGTLPNATGDFAFPDIATMVANTLASDSILRLLLRRTNTASGVWTGRSIEDGGATRWRLAVDFTEVISVSPPMLQRGRLVGRIRR